MDGDCGFFERRYRFNLTATLFEGIAAAASYCTLPLGCHAGLRERYCSYAAKTHISSTASYYRAKNPALCARLVDYKMEATAIRITTGNG